MRYKFMKETTENKKRFSGVSGVVAMIALAAFSAALSTGIGMLLPLMISCAAFSYLAYGAKSPIGASLCAVLSFALVFIFTRDFMTASRKTLIIILAGVLIVYLKRRGAGTFASSLALGGVFAATAAVFFLIGIYREYGSIAGGATKYFTEMYASVKARILELSASGGGSYMISESAIDDAVSAFTSMIPGIAALMIQLIGAEAYLVYRVFYRIAEGAPDASRETKAIPRAVPVFLAVSFIVSLVFSISEKTELLYISAVNMVISLALPTMFDGIRRLIRRIRRPGVIETPTGPLRRRPPLLFIILIVNHKPYGLTEG